MQSEQKRAGLFIVLEGVHGAGKTTQAALLTEWLLNWGFAVHGTREVGGTELGEKIRTLVTDPQYAHDLVGSPKTLLFLVLAARNVHVRQIIIPALAQGKIVVSERFTGSTYAIQHSADGLPWDVISPMVRFASESIDPDLTILLDISAQEGWLRKVSQGISGFWDARSIQYQDKVVQGYRQVAHQMPNWVTIDATPDPETVFGCIQKTVSPFLDELRRRGGAIDLDPSNSPAPDRNR